MSDARERVEASKAARERGHPATCECKGTGLIPVSGFTSGYAPCTRVAVEPPPPSELAALRAEIERLRDLHDANEIETRRLIRERDEARASLARVTEERDQIRRAMLEEERLRHEEDRAHLSREAALMAECARLRAEGAAAEARGFAAAQSAAAVALADEAAYWRDLPGSDTVVRTARWQGVNAAADRVRALRPPPPATGPAPGDGRRAAPDETCLYRPGKSLPNDNRPSTTGRGRG